MLFSCVAEPNPGITKVWADSGYRTEVIDYDVNLGIDFEIIRLTCDYEARPPVRSTD